MKSCPTCNRTYPDDTLAFCLMDGSVLSAPFDPATKPPELSARDTTPPRTEVLNAAAQSQPLRETKAASTPANLSPTITSPFQPQPIAQGTQTTPPFEASAATTKLPDIARWMFMLRGVAAILFGLVLLLWRVT
jgi:hypothetical protein